MKDDPASDRAHSTEIHQLVRELNQAILAALTDGLEVRLRISEEMTVDGPTDFLDAAVVRPVQHA